MSKRKPWGIYVLTVNDEELTLWFPTEKLRNKTVADFRRQNAKIVKKTYRGEHG